MEDMRSRGSVNRIKNCASDLLSMEDDLIDDDEESWELIGRDLRLKSTFIYCDLNQVISRATDDELKKTLTELGNRFFHYMEELDHAVKSRSISLTQVCYQDTAMALQEMLAALMSCN